jgi:hypothetical protein
VTLAHEVSKEPKVLRELMVREVHKAILAHEDSRAHKEPLVLLVTEVHKVV